MSMARTFDSKTRAQGVSGSISSLFGYPTKIWQNRYMVQNFFRRDLMSRFHGSFLGAWWMLVQPIFTFLIYFVIFGVLYNKIGEPPSIGFALYLFSGVICFHSLVEATTTCCNIIVTNSNLVKKVAFPSEVLPIHVGLIALVIYLVGVALTLIIAAACGHFYPGIGLLYLPLVLIVQFLLIIGMGLFLANANVFVRDVQQVWRIFSMAWFFMSPIFWHPSFMAEKVSSPLLLSIIFNANPAYSLLMAQRIAIGGEIPAWGIVDFWGNLGAAATWAVGFLLVGYFSFMANKHKYADIV